MSKRAEPFIWAGASGITYLAIAGSAGPWWLTALQWLSVSGLMMVGLGMQFRARR